MKCLCDDCIHTEVCSLTETFKNVYAGVKEESKELDSRFVVEVKCKSYRNNEMPVLRR